MTHISHILRTEATMSADFNDYSLVSVLNNGYP